MIVRETASALAAFADDPQGLVTACRRIVARQPTSGPLVWLCARVLTSGDPSAEVWRALDDAEGDRTAAELAHAIPEDATVLILGWPEQVASALARRGDLGILVADTSLDASGLVERLVRKGHDAEEIPLRGLGAAAASVDVVLLEALAVGPKAFLAAASSRAAAATARHAEVPVWMVGGVGRLLPARMWDALAARVEALGGEIWEAEVEEVPLDLVDGVVSQHGVESVEEALRRTDCPVAPELCRGDLVL